MFELRIYPRGSPSVSARIWPAGCPPPEGFVQEASEYVFEAIGSGLDDCDLLVDDQKLLALRAKEAGSARWLWEPGFYAGSVELSLVRGSRLLWGGHVVLDPDLAKLTRGQFDQMVCDILGDTFALFSLSSARKGIARGPRGQTPPIARLEFLRSRLERIDDCIREINATPIRLLTAEERRIPAGMAPRIRPTDLARSFHRETLRALPSTNHLSGRFGGLFPSRLRIATRRTHLDVGEHRAIKAELRNWSTWLISVARNLDRKPRNNEDESQCNARKAWVVRCRKMAQRIQRLLQLPIFKEVADVNQPLVLTSVFRWVVPYRKFFNLSRDFRLGLTRITGDFLNLPLARTYDLYELWAFLRLGRAGVELFGVKNVDVSELFTSSGSTGEIRVSASSVSIRLGRGTSLSFKRSYEEYWLSKLPGKPGSFSRTMIPDMSLAVDSPAEETSIVVLDAKYRVDQQLSDALASLHTYRDAIVREADSKSVPHRVVKGAYLVTPHVPDNMVAEGVNDWKEYKVPCLLFHPKYRQAFRFGALTFRPGMADGEAVKALTLLLADAGLSSRV